MPRREMRAARYLSSRINTQVNNEDRWLCSRVQRGLASGSYRPGPLSRLERWMLEFHDLLRERIPEFVIGRPGWDNWLLWFARSTGASLIDASAVVCAVHQNHDYGYHPEGETGVWQGEEAQENYKLLEGHRKFATLENATHILRADGLHPNYRHWLVQSRRRTSDYLSPLWFRFLDFTRPIRHRLNLRRRSTPSTRP